MKTLYLAMLRLWIYCQLRAVEATLDGQDTCLELVRDPSLHLRITLARQDARRERDRLRQAYNQTLPVGYVKVWAS